MNKARILLQAKFPDIKKEYGIDKLRITYSITLSNLGDVEDVKFYNTFPEVPFGKRKDVLENDLLHIVRHYPKMKPAKFKGEKVHSILLDKIIY